MPTVKDLDVALRAYVPAFDHIGIPTPEAVTLSNMNTIRNVTGLTWEPALEPQFRRRPITDDDGVEIPGMEAYEEVEGRRYITRGVHGPILGSATGSYHTFLNEELFGIAETIGVVAMEDGRAVTCLAGGQIHGGKRVFLLFDLGVTELAGDPSPHVRYMTLLSSHSGNGAIKVFGTSMRWHCTNALRAMEVEAAKQAAAFAFRHTANARARLADSRQAIAKAMLQHDAIEERSAAMLATRAAPARVSEYLAQFALAHVVSKVEKGKEQLMNDQRQKAVTGVERELSVILASSTCDGIRDSAYGAFAATVEYLDNVRQATSYDTQFERTMVNTERSKVLGFQLARKIF